MSLRSPAVSSRDASSDDCLHNEYFHCMTSFEWQLKYFHSAYAVQARSHSKIGMECDLPSVHRNSGGVTENSPVY